jgi:glycerol-3-phosphate acyltransferase PlsY
MAFLAWTIGLTSPFRLAWSNTPIAVVATIDTVPFFMRHHQSIARLLGGTEPRFGSGAGADLSAG